MTSGWWPEIRAAKEGLFWMPVGTLFTLNGTAVPDPFGPGFSSDVARGLIDAADGLWAWQPIGYPAATYPMGPSVQVGREGLCRQIDRHTGKIALSGYSQGALVVDIVWRDDILNPNGALHHRKDDVVAIINYGDPMRCPGVANGNVLAGRPLPTKHDGYATGGIAGPGDLTREQTPDFLLSFANDGDLYACCPTGDDPWHHEVHVAYNERMIFNIVMNTTATSILAIAKEVVELLDKPLVEVVPLVESILNGMNFYSRGMNSSHFKYGGDVGPAVRYLVERGHELRAAARVARDGAGSSVLNPTAGA